MMASGATRQVMIRFLGDTKDLDQAAGRGERSVSAWGKATSKVLGTIGALVAGAQLIDFFKQGVSGAADLEQSIGAVDSVFKDSAQQIHAWADSAATDVGLSANAYREMATTVGAQLKNMGIAQEDVAIQADDLIGKGADLAAQFGGPTSEAVAALGSLLRGETDPIERYGISIKQADINAKLAEMGLDGLEGQAAKTARTQALLTLVNEQGADAWGTFARETDTASGQAQIAAAQFEDMRTTVGAALLPVLTEFGQIANETLIPALQQSANWLQENSDTIGPLVKVAGGAAVAVGGLAVAVKGVQVARSITNTALIPFSAGVERLDKHAPGAARGVRGIGRAARVAGGALTGLLVIEQINNAFGEGADDLRRWYDVLTAGTEDDPAAQLKIVEEELARLKEQIEDAPDTDLGPLGTIYWTDWSGEVVKAADQADHLEEKKKDLVAQIEAEKVATQRNTSSTKDGTAATQDAASAAEDQADALDELIDKLDEASGRVLSQRDAARQLEEAYDAATEAIEENGAGLDITTEAGRANQAALDDVAQAALDEAEANLRAGASMKSVRADMREARSEFIRVATQMGLTEDEAKALADRLGLIPGNYKATVDAEDEATPTINKVSGKLDDLDGKTARTFIRTVETVGGYTPGPRSYGRASGGPVMPGWMLVGEEGPELVRFGSAGTVMQHEESMGLLRGMAAGGDVHVNVEISRHEIEGIAQVTVERNGRKTRRAVLAGAMKS